MLDRLPIEPGRARTRATSFPGAATVTEESSKPLGAADRRGADGLQGVLEPGLSSGKNVQDDVDLEEERHRPCFSSG